MASRLPDTKNTYPAYISCIQTWLPETFKPGYTRLYRYCFYFPSPLQGSRSPEESPDNGDMLYSRTRETGSNRTPRVLAVLPDLSGYRTTDAESVEIAEAPRRAVPNRSLRRMPVSRQRGSKAFITVSIFLVVLTLITWKIATQTQVVPESSPLTDSYMTRFATPPQQTTDEVATSTDQP